MRDALGVARQVLEQHIQLNGCYRECLCAARIPEVGICVIYRLNGEIRSHLPSNPPELCIVRLVFENLRVPALQMVLVRITLAVARR